MTEALLYARFCGNCEALLNLDTLSDLVKCEDCGAEVPFEQLARIRTKVTKTFARRDLFQEEEEPKLPLTEHECEKCGHAQAYYYNRQMRSADEGETTFYICQKCDHQTSTNN